MHDQTVREGFAPEGEFPPKRKKHTCMNERCPRFNQPILGRTKQEAKAQAKARLKKEHPTAILFADEGGVYSWWFNHDTWIIEIEHRYRNDPDKKTDTDYTFQYSIKDGQPEEKAVVDFREGPHMHPTAQEEQFERQDWA